MPKPEVLNEKEYKILTIDAKEIISWCPGPGNGETIPEGAETYTTEQLYQLGAEYAEMGTTIQIILDDETYISSYLGAGEEDGVRGTYVVWMVKGKNKTKYNDFVSKLNWLEEESGLKSYKK